MISFVATGNVMNVTSFPAPLEIPVGLLPGDFLLASLASKYEFCTISPSTGYLSMSNISGGAGASGEDSGNAYLNMYYRIVNGGEANVNVNMAAPVAGAIVVARMAAWRKTTPGSWIINSGSGIYTHTAGGAWTVTMPSSFNGGVRVGDILIPVSAVNGGLAVMTSPTLTATGLTVTGSTLRSSNRTSGGDGVALVVGEHTVSGGNINVVVTYSMTGTDDGVNYPAGPTQIIRLRESDSDKKRIQIM